jgi:hypothetical protein
MPMKGKLPRKPRGPLASVGPIVPRKGSKPGQCGPLRKRGGQSVAGAGDRPRPESIAKGWLMCSHNPRTAFGFDSEDGCFRCSQCGALVTDPPKWLKEKYAAKVEEFGKRLERRLRSFQTAYPDK